MKFLISGILKAAWVHPRCGTVTPPLNTMVMTVSGLAVYRLVPAERPTWEGYLRNNTTVRYP